ncbi:MAG: N-acetylmuramoyl-L-alanine amidase [Planctomycetota bacterium]|nr:MAG: N-acetylmuramoyl-L-alanine amidase [Planctomycetota bacterium]
MGSPADRRFLLHAAGYGATALAAGLFVLWLAKSAAPRADAVRERPARPLDPLTAEPRAFDWTEPPLPRFPIPPYAEYLKDVVIVVDPGHGGRGDDPNWKRGPTGLREAEVNLRVARMLREFLLAAGARVTLTRDADVYLDADKNRDLRKRAEIANRLRADLLLSIHHNAAANPEANYTTVFYHGRPDDSPASLAVGQYLVDALHDALRLERQLPCALQSDATMYDNGFGVLRAVDGPAVLTEASFHSNPREESRLRDALYNRREAYGLFLGLARWAYAGLPRVTLVSPTSESARRSGGAIVVRLEDGLTRRGGMGANQPAIIESSITVRIDDRPARFSFDPRTRLLRIALPDASPAARRELFVQFRNRCGQPVLRPRIVIP